MNAQIPAWKVVVLGVAAYLLFAAPKTGGCNLTLPSIAEKATAATYVYEKDQGEVPAAVRSGLNRLNIERAIRATEFEQDTTVNGKTPAQYVVPLDAAKKNGLPSLVATAGDKVLKVTKAPKTEEEVLGGVP